MLLAGAADDRCAPIARHLRASGNKQAAQRARAISPERAHPAGHGCRCQPLGGPRTAARSIALDACVALGAPRAATHPARGGSVPTTRASPTVLTPLAGLLVFLPARLALYSAVRAVVPSAQ